MEQVNEAQPQSQPPSQRFYALEQLGELAGTITLISEGLQAYRAQVAGLLAGQKKAEAFELYRLLERQRTYLVEQIRATRPFLMELENPLAPAAQKLAEQLAAFPLMTADYPHIVKGRIIKEKHTVTDENRGPHGRLISTEIRETISNRMIFNILTPSGFRSLT